MLKDGTYSRRGKTLQVTHDGSLVRITVDGVDFEFNDLGLIMNERKESAAVDEEKTPRTKVPTPPRF